MDATDMGVPRNKDDTEPESYEMSTAWGATMPNSHLLR